MSLFLAMLLFSGCTTSGQAQTDLFAEFTYTHYSSGGTPEKYTAVILFEQSCSTFTAYQVAFASCNCRDPLVSYLSVCYVELLNTKKSSEDAAIRTITFGNNMGLYGDSNPNYYILEYTEEYMDENFVQCLVGAPKSDFDGWQGYGSQLSSVDMDAVSGATVTTSNVTSMLKALFQYHAEKYYSEKNK
ncbi:MAG: hypothetical protein CVU91_08185 [Firmicutes bacterium HGW-Firmicutes-16]|nr:MAG: hypothetical protein CVU91_08185 [Firmicutes bacterium HGW-Firmicutes-16]